MHLGFNSNPTPPTNSGGNLPSFNTGAPLSPEPEKPQESTSVSTLKGIGQIILEFIITLVIIFIISWVIRIYVLQPFIVEGQSMEPNFHNQEYLLAEKVSSYLEEYRRGQVLIFHSPIEDFNLIKRIIGLPGERIVVDKGKVTIYPVGKKEGITIYEKYVVQDQNEQEQRVDFTLKSDEYFLMGDNRPNSRDSREFGPVKKSAIIGKVWLTIFPLLDVQMFSAPKYPAELSWLIFPIV